ncbi:DUF2382 domain-containing protein [Trichormus variabilis]|uniref:DUF2382 domain-containing protein n=1 Tax=Trichormus variabilis SAG 1403-4b TaxID=447716 RepID=A0A433UMV7_ANAVA|nr:DUF2382 domain-containing protein [Trichormus variabilis]MBD2624887.1 DUF2382 domain-containing protein [Trichormus variabilis FACHB-164]RUS95176.1 hypothetical protein DSM107003_33760 [Trichormus variabilis SAG 1403-4b]
MPEYLSSETINDHNLETNTSVSSEYSAVVEEKIISLLEEKLVVNNRKQKVGEVIIRKEIETYMIQVPVRREKLIIEQVSPEHKQLAEIDLSQGEISGVELTIGEIPQFTSFDSNLMVSGEFSSPKIVSLLLNAIALEQNHGCQKIKLAIILENESQQQKYQEWFNRCSQSQQPKFS